MQLPVRPSVQTVDCGAMAVAGVTMENARELRRRIERFLRMRRQFSDPAAVKAIGEVADELELTAAEIERRHRIRERAHAIWTKQGRPHGRDVEFWLAAEQEVDIQRRR
jgi:DUF2934 family protein